jgi:cell division protein ZapD
MDLTVILYEHPLNERVRTYLRLEYLFRRFELLFQREHAIDHHFCFSTVFELVEVGGRADLKSDILKDLERYKQQFLGYRGNPAVAEATLEKLLSNVASCFEGMNSSGVKIGQFVAESEWLSSLRNRMSIPGGTCGFDMPAYHAWQQLPAERRREDILRWTEPLQPLYSSVNLLLGLMRDTASAQMVVAVAGQFQQNLPQGRYQLLRLRMDSRLRLVPEISGNRMMVSVRMVQSDDQARLLPFNEDVNFEMALCQ